MIAQEVKKFSQKVHESADSIGKDTLAVTDNIELVVKGNSRLQDHILESEKEIQGTIQEFNKIGSVSHTLEKQAEKLETIIE